MFTRKTGLIERFRYWVISTLVGKMPVVMNVVIARPNEFKGPLVQWDGRKDGICSNNYFLGSERDALIEPVQDVAGFKPL